MVVQATTQGCKRPYALESAATLAGICVAVGLGAPWLPMYVSDAPLVALAAI